MPEVLVMSKAAWDKLTPEDQAIVRQAAKDSVRTLRELWAAREKASEEKVRAAGVEIVDRHRQAAVHRRDGAGLREIRLDAELQSLVERIQAVE